MSQSPASPSTDVGFDAREAVDRTVARSTATIESVTTIEIGTSATLRLQVDGSVQFDGTQSRMRIDGMPGAGIVEMIVDGSNLYLLGFGFSGVPPDTWLHIDKTDDDPVSVDARSVADGSTDGVLALYYLYGMDIAGATESGPDELAGVHVRTVRSRCDLADALDSVPPAIKSKLDANLDKMLGAGYDGTLDCTVSVDDDGLIRHVAYRLEAGTGASRTQLGMDYAFSDLGEPVDLDLPGPGEYVEVADLDLGGS